MPLGIARGAEYELDVEAKSHPDRIDDGSQIEPSGACSQDFGHQLHTGGVVRRCSAVQSFACNPAILGPEIQMMVALIAQHVDDSNSTFAIRSTANLLKDFVGTYFTGTVAAGLAFLTMVKDGYVWISHFESIAGGHSNEPSPDFVFAHRNFSGLALVESKGTRNYTRVVFNGKLQTQYDRQIAPHLGTKIGGGWATHGYCIGSHLKSPNSSELFIHHTAESNIAAEPPSSVGDIAVIQQQSFAIAFRLAHGMSLATQVRQGQLGAMSEPFFQFRWLDRHWINGPNLGFYPYVADAWQDQGGSTPPDYGLRPTFRFAVERGAALSFLRQLSRPEREPSARFHFETVPDDLRERGREARGAVFPNGLALIPDIDHVTDRRQLYWDPRRLDLSDTLSS